MIKRLRSVLGVKEDKSGYWIRARIAALMLGAAVVITVNILEPAAGSWVQSAGVIGALFALLVYIYAVMKDNRKLKEVDLSESGGVEQ